MTPSYPIPGSLRAAPLRIGPITFPKQFIWKIWKKIKINLEFERIGDLRPWSRCRKLRVPKAWQVLGPGRVGDRWPPARSRVGALLKDGAGSFSRIPAVTFLFGGGGAGVKDFMFEAVQKINLKLFKPFHIFF